jgi:hypothetical protein
MQIGPSPHAGLIQRSWQATLGKDLAKAGCAAHIDIATVTNVHRMVIASSNRIDRYDTMTDFG